MEEGYVLISAIWLLLLGASIVAAISLLVLRQSEDFAFERQEIQRKLALESAYQTVIADILFNGPRSSFAILPANDIYNLNGVRMTIKIVSETGKVDINNADSALVERVMRGLQIPSSSRNQYLSLYRKRLNDNITINNIADLEKEMQRSDIKLATSSDINSGLCVSQFFTAHSGLSQPSSVHSPSELNRALSAPHTGGARLRMGDAIHITITPDKGLALIAIVRITGRLDNPVAILDWRYENDCSISNELSL